MLLVVDPDVFQFAQRLLRPFSGTVFRYRQDPPFSSGVLVIGVFQGFFAQETAGLMLRRNVFQLGMGDAASVERPVASGLKDAAVSRPFGRRWHASANGPQLGIGQVVGQPGDAAEQPPGVRVGRLGEQVVDEAFFNQLPGIHDAQAVADPGHHAQVVSDEDDTGVEILFQVFDQVQHRGLNGYVQGGGRFVHDQQGRVVEHGHGNDHALLLPTRNHVRVAVHDVGGIGHVYPVEHLNAVFPGFFPGHVLVRGEHFRQLPADAE